MFSLSLLTATAFHPPPPPSFVFFFFGGLRSERKTLLYQRQTSGEPDLLSADTGQAVAAKLPSAPASRKVNKRRHCDTRTHLPDRSDEVNVGGASEFQSVSGWRLVNMHRHTPLQASGFLAARLSLHDN